MASPPVSLPVPVVPESCRKELIECPDTDDGGLVAQRQPSRIGCGDNSTAKAESSTFPNTHLRSPDGSYLSREPHLAHHQKVGRERPVEVARRNRGDHTEIRRRFIDVYATHHVQEDITIEEP